MKSGIRVQVMPRARMFVIVTMKLIAPASDDSVSTWRERIQEVLAAARLVERREGRVGRPAGRGRAALGEEAEVEDQSPEQVNQ